MHPLLEEFHQRYPDMSECMEDICQAVDLLDTVFRGGGKLLVCGNGGSASDSEHIVGELMKGFRLKRPLSLVESQPLMDAFPVEHPYLASHLQGALPAISLVSQSALLTATSNDVGADMIFAQQVYGYGRKGDIVMGISTSGNSKNICRALQVAHAFGMYTLGLLGASEGSMLSLCDVAIRVPAYSVTEIQERHLPIYHVICAYLEEKFFNEADADRC
jgi:phosphoheptose isomerase